MANTEFYQPSTNAYFSLSEHNSRLLSEFRSVPNLLTVYVNQSESDIHLSIDGEFIKLSANQITTGTFIQKIEIPKNQKGLMVFSFNREFYCLEEHEAEVSCNGIIFFGAKEVPVITIPEEDETIFNSLANVFWAELAIKDSNQEKMLQMLLKRLIILITRYAKAQILIRREEPHHIELIRDFYALVDTNYRKLHTVAEYADLLHKSPKTLSNMFAKHGLQAPITIIHERIMLESKHFLLSSNRSIKEIMISLGFRNSNTFYKLFRKQNGLSPQDYRNKQIGKNVINNGKNEYSPAINGCVKPAYKTNLII